MCAIRASCPPKAAANGQRAKASAVATDATAPGVAGDIAVLWQGNVNDPNGTMSGFARSFTAAPASLKNDFRVDLAGHATLTAPRAARSPFSNSYALTWRDTRAAGPHVYARVVSAAP